MTSPVSPASELQDELLCLCDQIRLGYPELDQELELHDDAILAFRISRLPSDAQSKIWSLTRGVSATSQNEDETDCIDLTEIALKLQEMSVERRKAISDVATQVREEETRAEEKGERLRSLIKANVERKSRSKDAKKIEEFEG